MAAHEGAGMEIGSEPMNQVGFVDTKLRDLVHDF